MIRQAHQEEPWFGRGTMCLVSGLNFGFSAHFRAFPLILAIPAVRETHPSGRRIIGRPFDKLRTCPGANYGAPRWDTAQKSIFSAHFRAFPPSVPWFGRVTSGTAYQRRPGHCMKQDSRDSRILLPRHPAIPRIEVWTIVQPARLRRSPPPSRGQALSGHYRRVAPATHNIC